MVRIVNSNNVTKVTKFLLEKFKLNMNVENLVYFFFGFLIFNHISACTFYYIAKLEEFETDTWITKLGVIDLSYIEVIYIFNFY
jgi:hypothetical protein